MFQASGLFLWLSRLIGARPDRKHPTTGFHQEEAHIPRLKFDSFSNKSSLSCRLVNPFKSDSSRK